LGPDFRESKGQLVEMTKPETNRSAVIAQGKLK